MEQRNSPPTTWNRTEVSKYLVPFLRLADALRADTDAGEDSAPFDDTASLKRIAWSTLCACPAAYRQLSRVYHRADDETYHRWFGGIDCDDELLAAAFALIDRALSQNLPTTQHKKAELSSVEEPSVPSSVPTAQQAESVTAPPPAPSSSQHTEHHLTEDAAFRQLFRVSHTYTDEQSGKVRLRQMDLLVPFVELCRAREDTERRQAEEQCRAAVRAHLSDYIHALSYYRAHYADTDAADCLLPETHTCMQCLEQVIARCDYEAQLADKKAALEYERGGLGWFGRTRKREIDAALRDISISALELKIEDERERLQTITSPLQARLSALQKELSRAPVTAFRRKKELRAAIEETQHRLEQIESQSDLATLRAHLAAMQKKQKK
ncbi:MAG: hypothetical protein IJW40_03070 [Clostridia bacterium]|nr:hypothetical protein [Clostridia bacterium]